MEETESDHTIMFRRPLQQASSVVHALLLRQEGAPARRVSLGDGPPLTIGRGPANTLVLNSREVSRQHCSIGLVDATAVLTDLDSTNGVYVDGRRVSQAVTLQPGARIAIGPLSLIYQRGSAETLAEAEAAERELAQAIDYMRALLPPPLRNGPVRAEWRFVPSDLLGGDAFGYRWLNEQRLSVFLLDVCGHGVSSALLAASATNMLRTSRLRADFADPAAVLNAMNAAFQMDEHNGLFFTMWYGVYELPSRTLRYGSAGHHPSYLAHGATLLPLVTGGPAIGMAPSELFAAATTAVPRGALLHLFSDGAFEVTRADGKPASIDDLLELLARPGRDMPEPNRVFEDLRELTGFRPFEDDVSLLTLEFP